MYLIKPNFDILEMTGLDLIEKAGRTCYKSEDKITKDSAGKFVEMLDKRGHHAMIEHSLASVRIICDRGVTHEIVRHRLFSFAQESTRYCNYGKDKFGGVTFIIPPWVNLEEGHYSLENETTVNTYGISTSRKEFEEKVGKEGMIWFMSCLEAEKSYLSLIESGWSPQQARSVLPNSLKTEIVVTGNFREWKHFFKLRTSAAAHPQMQEIAKPICEAFKVFIPAIKWNDEQNAS